MFDFTTVTAQSIVASTEKALADADTAIDAVVALDGPRTYANTMHALDLAILGINDAYGRGPFMARVHPDEDVAPFDPGLGQGAQVMGTDDQGTHRPFEPQRLGNIRRHILDLDAAPRPYDLAVASGGKDH